MMSKSQPGQRKAAQPQQLQLKAVGRKAKAPTSSPTDSDPRRQLATYCYEFPRPAVAVDLVVTRVVRSKRGKSRQLLLIERQNEPFAGNWALPGGFLEMDETLEAAAARELQEETAVNARRLVPLGAFSQVDRDPRGRVISFAYWTEVAAGTECRAGDDAAAARWFPVAKLPELAFDHIEIVAAARHVWKKK